MYQLADRPETSPASIAAVLARVVVPLLCALTGFLTEFTVNVGGALPLGEIILLAVFPVALAQCVFKRGWPAPIQQTRWFTTAVVAVGVMGLGYILSDLFRSTPANDLLRGWSRVVFLGIDLVAVTYLVGAGWKNLWIFVLCAALGQCAASLIIGPLAGDYWKFCFGFPVTILAVFLGSNRRPAWTAALTFVLGALHLALGFRSMGGICLLISMSLLVREVQGRWKLPLAVALFAVTLLTVTLIKANFDEADVHRGSNLERQSMIETSFNAFLDSPLIGQGSWFTTRQVARLEARLSQLDEKFTEYTPEKIARLTIHSQILVTLAEGGIFGGAFFFVYGALLIATFWLACGDPTPRRAFVLLLVLDGAWNFAMSPFSGPVRIWIALYVALGLLLWQERRGWLNSEPAAE